MVQTMVRYLRTADHSGGLVQSKIGPVRPVCDFQTGPQQHYSSAPHKDKDKMVANVLLTKDANVAEEGMDMDEETLMAMDATSSFYFDQNRKNNANYDYDVYLASRASNSETRMYDWLADSGSTNHITCWRDFFSSYEPTSDVTVYGISGKTHSSTSYP